jgi:hypothetical protein
MILGVKHKLVSYNDSRSKKLLMSYVGHPQSKAGVRISNVSSTRRRCVCNLTFKVVNPELNDGISYSSYSSYSSVASRPRCLERPNAKKAHPLSKQGV